MSIIRYKRLIMTHGKEITTLRVFAFGDVTVSDQLVNTGEHLAAKEQDIRILWGWKER